MTYVKDARNLFICLSLLAPLTPASFAQSTPPQFEKAFQPATIGPGSSAVLTFTITNTTAASIRGLRFVDNLPAGMTIASPGNPTTTCVGTVEAPDGGSTITFSDGGVPGSRACTITVQVTAGAAGTYSNISDDLFSDAGNSGNATADLIVASDRPGFTKQFSPSSVAFGGRSTLTLTVDNTANANNALNLTFADSLPSGMVIATPSNAATTCTGSQLTAAGGGTVIDLRPTFFGSGTVAAGATCTVTVDVLGNAVGVLGNSSGELTSTPPTFFPTRSSGFATGTLTVTREQISLTKSFTDDPVAPGGAANLQFVISNLDRDFDATAIAFTDDLDAVFPGLVATNTPLNDVCGIGSSLTGTSILTLTGGTVPVDQSCTINVTLQVPSTATGDGLNVTSSLTAEIDGRPVVGTPATDRLFVEPAPVLTQSFVNDPIGAGDAVELSYTITNVSQDMAAEAIAFDDTFDVVLPTASVVPASGFCGPGSSATFTPLIDASTGTILARLAVAGARLDAGATCTFSLTLDVAAGARSGTYPNTSSIITATVGGSPVSGRAASDELEIVGAPLLTQSFIDDPVAAGGTVTLRFQLSNDEDTPGDATNIAFSNNLDATLGGLVATGLPTTDVCGVGSTVSGGMTLTFSGGTLAPGESCTFDVAVTVPAGATPGSYANTTSAVVADVLGIATIGNAAADALDIAGLVLGKDVTDDPVLPGGTVTVRYTIENVSPASNATAIAFQDNLDGTLDDLAVVSVLPLTDPCGTGSSLLGLSGNRLLVLQGGSLAAGTSCTFDVTAEVPATTEPDTYGGSTGALTAIIDGTTNVAFPGAFATLEVANDFLLLEKQFLDDPVGPGETVVLRFSITNLNSTETIGTIAFSDDLDAALGGLTSISGPSNDVCGVGSLLEGTNLLTFTGGSLAPSSTCTFDVSLMVPPSVELGSVVENVTSSVSGTIGGLPVVGGPATDELLIDFMTFSKSFGGEVFAGDTVTLTFTIENLSNAPVGGVGFSDDLDGMLSGAVALGLPALGICGEDSSIDGESFLTMTGATILPGGSCSFAIDVAVPKAAAPGSYINTTSSLRQANLRIADPALATLVVLEDVDTDADGDGVLDGLDVCPGTIIPEGVPTVGLRPNRYALIDADFIFDTPGGRNRIASARDEDSDSDSDSDSDGKPGQTVFTTTDTAGCSCEQIIEALGLGNGHRKFGCSLGAMREWVTKVNP